MLHPHCFEQLKIISYVQCNICIKYGWESRLQSYRSSHQVRKIKCQFNINMEIHSSVVINITVSFY